MVTSVKGIAKFHLGMICMLWPVSPSGIAGTIFFVIRYRIRVFFCVFDGDARASRCPVASGSWWVRRPRWIESLWDFSRSILVMKSEFVHPWALSRCEERGTRCIPYHAEDSVVSCRKLVYNRPCAGVPHFDRLRLSTTRDNDYQLPHEISFGRLW
jgi:hypothetical protein